MYAVADSADAPAPAHKADQPVNEITPEQQVAVEKGLAFLASQQNAEGSFGNSVSYGATAAITALSGIAFMADGNLPGRGKYGDNVKKAVDFIVRNQQESGLFTTSASQGEMYSHGFATLFLAEVYGMTPRADIREKLKLAVDLIVRSQNRDGGWRYFPVRHDADVSVTVCQIMALRAARNAGIFVPKNTVDRCTKYIKSCQNSDGGFLYQKILNPQSNWPRTAAGLVALYSAGIYEGDEISNALKYMMDHLPRGEMIRHEAFYFYGHYYAVQAMWQAGGQYWRQWYPAIRDELLGRQMQDGSWSDLTVNSEYGTAMACIVLQMPNNYLPIFQR